MLRTIHKRCHADHTLFVKRRGSQVTTIFYDYVATEEIECLKKYLGPECEMQDLGGFFFFFELVNILFKKGK